MVVHEDVNQQNVGRLIAPNEKKIRNLPRPNTFIYTAIQTFVRFSASRESTEFHQDLHLFTRLVMSPCALSFNGANLNCLDVLEMVGF